MAATGLPSADELALLSPYREQLPAELFSQTFRFPEVVTDEDYRTNIVRARELLNEAGWHIVDGVLRNAAGETFTIEFLTRGVGEARTLLPYFQRLKQLGIRGSMAMDSGTSEWVHRLRQFDFDALLASGLQPSRIGCVDNSGILPLSTPTYYQRLRDHSYRVACVGKLDLAKSDPYNGRDGDRPVAFPWGFTHPEECEGKVHAGSSRTPIGPYTRFLDEKGLLGALYDDYARRMEEGYDVAAHDSVLPTEAFEDNYIGERAAKWIEQAADDFPWHMFVSFVGPHSPFDPPTQYADRYRDAAMPEPVPFSPDGKPAWVQVRSKSYDPETGAITRRQYCAATEAVDDMVGRVLAAVDAAGQTDSTYVIFASDHGEMLGDHGMYAKSCPQEAALRVPLIIAGPGIEGGRTSDALVELIDVNPTICDLAALDPQPNIDARSVRPVLDGHSETHRTETVSAFRTFRLIRTHEHKLVENYDDVTELYDLQNDPDEHHNIADANPKIVARLARRMKERFQEGMWNR